MIKCFEPTIGEEESQFVLGQLKLKEIGFGDQVARFENRFRGMSGYVYNTGFNSASSAAYALFSWLKELYGSCEVYTPSLTFCSPIWAALENGHEIVFVDIDKNGLFSIDDYKKKKKQDSSKRKVVMPMMYGGVTTFDFSRFDGNEVTISDSAHAIHAPSEAGNPSATPEFTIFSFHPVKPICMSNGGMLSTRNRSAHKYFNRYRNFGRVNTGVSYDIVQNGFNFYMNSLNAVIGLAQLNKVYEMRNQRAQNFKYLKKRLEALNISGFYMFEHDLLSSFYLCTFTSDFFSGDVIRFLEQRGIQATYHYPPLHRTTQFKTECVLPNTEEISQHLVNLPIHQNLTDENLDKIVLAIADMKKKL